MVHALGFSHLRCLHVEVVGVTLFCIVMFDSLWLSRTRTQKFTAKQTRQLLHLHRTLPAPSTSSGLNVPFWHQTLWLTTYLARATSTACLSHLHAAESACMPGNLARQALRLVKHRRGGTLSWAYYLHWGCCNGGHTGGCTAACVIS